MNAARLNELLAQPRGMAGEDLSALENLCRDFPAFGLPYILLAKAYHDRNDYRFRETLHAAALRCPNRLWLRDFIEGKPEEDAALQRTPETSANVHSETSETQSLVDSSETETTLSLPTETTAESELIPAEGQTVTPPAATETPDLQEILPAAPEIMVSGDIPATVDLDDLADAAESIPEEIIELPKTETSAEPETLEIPVELPVQRNAPETIAPVNPDKPWRRKHIDPAAMTVYSIEDHFPPEEQSLESPGARDFFSWLRNPHKGPAPAPVKPETREEKDDLIQRFLETRPSVSRPKKDFFNPVNMAKKSELEDPGLVTETLANIYLNQGNRDKAIAMFEKLILKYPGKRPYFAALIQKIRQENES